MAFSVVMPSVVILLSVVKMTTKTCLWPHTDNTPLLAVCKIIALLQANINFEHLLHPHPPLQIGGGFGGLCMASLFSFSSSRTETSLWLSFQGGLWQKVGNRTSLVVCRRLLETEHDSGWVQVGLRTEMV